MTTEQTIYIQLPGRNEVFSSRNYLNFFLEARKFDSFAQYRSLANHCTSATSLDIPKLYSIFNLFLGQIRNQDYSERSFRDTAYTMGPFTAVR